MKERAAMDAGGTTSRVFMTTEQVTRSERLPYTALYT